MYPTARAGAWSGEVADFVSDESGIGVEIISQYYAAQFTFFGCVTVLIEYFDAELPKIEVVKAGFMRTPEGDHANFLRTVS
ncbi:MAG: Uncharacterised protein [Hyphomonas sp. TMED17]|nr:MAG: Uncharacterised protein [Hyphomonas sp. TMED17]